MRLDQGNVARLGHARRSVGAALFAGETCAASAPLDQDQRLERLDRRAREHRVDVARGQEHFSRGIDHAGAHAMHTSTPVAAPNLDRHGRRHAESPCR
ncbi:MAG: hypothetical protein U1E17_01570 [Geminicoccaceae bacterium]